MDINNNILYFCKTANFAGIKKCLEEGISPNFQNSEGESPLQVAAAYGFSNVVNLLTKNGALIDLPNNYGWTPLMQAARYGHVSTVALLLKLKAKVNICNKLSLTPLIAAVWSGSLPVVKLLVEAGAIINLMSFDNPSNESDLTGLMAASVEGHEDILKYLLEKGANVHQTSPVTGLSPLMVAACEGHEKLVRIIVEFGGSSNDIDVCGKSALDYAIEWNNEGVATYLRSVGVPKIKSEFPTRLQELPVVKIDSPDSVMFDNSVSMSIYRDLSPRSGFFSSGASESGKLSSCDRLQSKRSHTETKVKDWIGGVAQHLQHKMLSHMSSRHSSKSPNLDVQFGEESMNDVFETQNSSFEEYENDDLKASVLLSPNQYLAEALKEHTVEAIKPPFPPCSYSKVMKNLRAKKALIDSRPKPHRNYLLLPRLLKNYSKKHLDCSNEDSFRKSAASSKGTSCDENIKILKIPSADTEHFSALSLESLKFKNEGILDCNASAQNFEVQKVPNISKSPNISDSQNTPQNNFDANVSEDDLSVLLGKESLQKYAEKFRDQEVDLKTFQQLTKDDLTDIGILNSESQKKLFDLIKKLQNKE